MNRILALSIAAALGIALLAQGALPIEAAQKPKPSTGSANDAYLALGDSVAFGKGKTNKLQGRQPAKRGKGVKSK